MASYTGKEELPTKLTQIWSLFYDLTCTAIVLFKRWTLIEPFEVLCQVLFRLLKHDHVEAEPHGVGHVHHHAPDVVAQATHYLLRAHRRKTG